MEKIYLVELLSFDYSRVLKVFRKLENAEDFIKLLLIEDQIIFDRIKSVIKEKLGDTWDEDDEEEHTWYATYKATQEYVDRLNHGEKMLHKPENIISVFICPANGTEYYIREFEL